ncbi:enoyl-(Acyl carrier protein) reductase domain-containing protein [Ditylenchus destructor]|uniref:Enoyl-(Acyl carrier protein) reductase domain-containing protein n=1 Tax=Ditylenchus destructor TaxID=166010 RepID=A0AAD4N0R6_9BILA|nr:enoyl-(Acyl carrier protein) reductase domain-containing protein [Ditylenchus destructor]
MRKRSGSRSKAGNSEPSTKPNGASSENGSRSTKAVNGEKGDRSMPFAFADKVVIITGSSSGIGQDAAVLFAEHGASVVIHGQSEERIKKTEQLLSDAGIPPSKSLTILGSLENDSTLSEIIEKTVAKFGKVDILVNNAGIMGNPALGQSGMDSIENFDYVFRVNLRSVVHLTQLAIPYLEKTKGNVVNVGSIGSQRANYDIMYYVMAKAALDHFTKCAAVLYAPKEIRVNSVLPGATDTNFLSRHGIPEDVIKAGTKIYAEKFIPMGRMGRPREVASVIKFLASPEASYVTGAIWIVDGANCIMAPSLKEANMDLKK